MLADGALVERNLRSLSYEMVAVVCRENNQQITKILKIKHYEFVCLAI